MPCLYTSMVSQTSYAFFQHVTAGIISELTDLIDRGNLYRQIIFSVRQVFHEIFMILWGPFLYRDKTQVKDTQYNQWYSGEGTNQAEDGKIFEKSSSKGRNLCLHVLYRSWDSTSSLGKEHIINSQDLQQDEPTIIRKKDFRKPYQDCYAWRNKILTITAPYQR